MSRGTYGVVVDKALDFRSGDEGSLHHVVLFPKTSNFTPYCLTLLRYVSDGKNTEGTCNSAS